MPHLHPLSAPIPQAAQRPAANPVPSRRAHYLTDALEGAAFAIIMLAICFAPALYGGN